jgi:hypothetical protein
MAKGPAHLFINLMASISSGPFPGLGTRESHKSRLPGDLVKLICDVTSWWIGRALAIHNSITLTLSHKVLHCGLKGVALHKRTRLLT